MKDGEAGTLVGGSLTCIMEFESSAGVSVAFNSKCHFLTCTLRFWRRVTGGDPPVEAFEASLTDYFESSLGNGKKEVAAPYSTCSYRTKEPKLV